MERALRARDLVLDIRSGMDDAALMEKYGLTPRGLQNLFDELAYLGYLDHTEHREVKPAKIRIGVNQFVTDMRSGLPESELMQKYGLSQKGLARAKKKLVKARFIAPEEAPDDREAAGDAVFVNLRRFERQYLDFDLPILDVNAVDIAGRVRDITEQGLGVIGIPAQTGEVKSLLVLPRKGFLIKPFLIDARCCWARRSDGNRSPR